MTHPKRVLYFNSWSTAHGGSSTSLLDLVRTLDRRRFDPVVVCPEPGELPERLTELRVPVIVHPLSRWNRGEAWRFVREVPWYLRLLRQQHVALVHGNTSSSRRSILQATALARLPYVQHVRNGVQHPRRTFGCRVATRIIVNSNDAGRALYDDPMLAPKTITVHNAVDLAAYDAADDRREELGAQDWPIVGFVGQIVPRKGITTLVRAMVPVIARVPGARLVIVGCPPPDDRAYFTECRALAGRLGISDRVHFAGHRRDVPAWMRTFDVFAFPTRAEPFGKVVVEAMAAGCPVVASRVGGIPEIVTDPGLGTLIPPEDDKALSAALVEYLTDRARARAVGEAGRHHARARFSLEEMTRRLEELYDSVLSSRSPAAARGTAA